MGGLRDPLRSEFARPMMAQEALFRAVREPLDCILLGDLHHVLKVMGSRALLPGTLAAFASGEDALTLTCEV
jgi:hypothetical protein